MSPKISLALLAVAALLQLSHGIPTHRLARETQRDFASKIKDYVSKFSGSGSSGSAESSGTGSSVDSSSSSTSSAVETTSGSEAAASEPQSSIAAKEGSSSESGLTSSYQNYLPSFGSYPSQLPSQFNPGQYSQYGQYPSQFPSQFNPQQYLGSSGSAAAPSAAAPAGAASEPQPSVAAKEGSSSESGLTSSYQNYLPSFGSYPSQLPSQFNPGQYSQYGQYPSQFPSQFNPQQYLGSSGSAAAPSAAAPAGAASEPQPSVATKEGSSSESGLTSSYQNYLPSFGSYPSQLPSQFNPGQYSQYSQYPSQFPSQFNPQQYLGSSAASPGAAQGASTSTP